MIDTIKARDKIRCPLSEGDVAEEVEKYRNEKLKKQNNVKSSS